MYELNQVLLHTEIQNVIYIYLSIQGGGKTSRAGIPEFQKLEEQFDPPVRVIAALIVI